jgi:SpoIIAA-like
MEWQFPSHADPQQEEDVMFATVENLPPGTIGFVAQNQITAADRDEVLDPTIAFALENGPVRLLYVIGADFTGYDHGFYDDVVFGTRHFTDFARIAFVAEDGPFSRAVRAMDGLMPTALRVFEARDLDAARAWLAEEGSEEDGSQIPVDGHDRFSDWIHGHAAVGGQ